MKKILLFTAALLITVASFGQKWSDMTPAQKGAVSAQEYKEAVTDLSQEQFDKIAAIQTERFTKAAEAANNPNLTKEERKEARNTYKKAAFKQINALLTPEQIAAKKQYDADKRAAKEAAKKQ